MPRGPYRKYLKDLNIPIPRTTLRRRQNQQEDIRPENQEEDRASSSSDDDQSAHANSNITSVCCGESNNEESMDRHEEAAGERCEAMSVTSAESVSAIRSDHNLSVNSSDNSDIGSAVNDDISFSDADSIRDWESDSGSEPGGNVPNDYVEFECEESDDEARQVMYTGCDITFDESKLLILSYAMRFGLSDTALEHLLLLIDSHLPSSQHGSLYRFLKHMPKPPTVITHFYCAQEECQRLVVFNETNLVNNCECGAVCNKNDLKNQGCFFMQIPLKEQLEKILSNEDVWKQLRWEDSTQSDVITGKVYKTLMDRGALSKPDISLQFNTDGVQIFKSSKNELWPFQVCINELPFKARRENILLCGLWLGPGKPNMNTFLEPIIQELNNLHNEGFELENGVNIKVHTIISSVDSMARAPLQNIKTFRGKQGCNFCLHDGEECTVGRGTTRVYRGDVGVARSERQHLQDTAEVVRTGTVVNGIKGPSVLLLLQSFNIITSFVPDYLHCVLLGVCKTMVEWWSSGKNKDKPFYIGNNAKVNEIDDILLTIKPPSEVTRTPRSLHQRKLWKASEWKNFLLYYSIVCLKAVNFPKRYLDHWFLLVYSMSVFLQEHITNENYDRAKLALREFVLTTENIYGEPELMKFNFHLLLHIPKSVKDYGALWTVSTFPYEHYNGLLGKMFRSSQAVPQQICKSYLRLQSLKELASELLQNNHTPPLVRDLYSKLSFGRKTSYCCKVGQALRLLGTPNFGTLNLIRENVVVNLVGERIQNDNVSFYSRFIYNNVLFHLEDYQRMSKRMNSVVQIETDEYLSITHVLMISTAVSNQTLCVVLGSKLHSTGELLCTNRALNITSSLVASVVQRSNECMAVYPHMIRRKCIVTPNPDDKRKLCCVPLVNSVERD